MLELIPLAIYGFVASGGVFNVHQKSTCWALYGISNVLWVVYACLQFPVSYGIVVYALGMNFLNLYGAFKWRKKNKSK